MTQQWCLCSCNSVHCCCWITPMTNLHAVTHEYIESSVSIFFSGVWLIISSCINYSNYKVTYRKCPYLPQGLILLRWWICWCLEQVRVFYRTVIYSSPFLHKTYKHSSAHPQISKQSNFCLFLVVCPSWIVSLFWDSKLFSYLSFLLT